MLLQHLEELVSLVDYRIRARIMRLTSTLTRSFTLGEFMRNKRRKLDLQNEALLDEQDDSSALTLGGHANESKPASSKVNRRPLVFDGCHIYVSEHLHLSGPTS